MITKTIVLLEQALRLHDNPALSRAARQGEVIPVYIYEENSPNYVLGSASKWWLHHSLAALESDLDKHGVKLILRKGETVKAVLKLVQETDAKAVYWNRCYEPQQIEKYKQLKAVLSEKNIEAKSFKSGLLFEPSEVLNKQGTFFKVFTPFWNHCRKVGVHENPLPLPEFSKTSKQYVGDALGSWKLLPHSPDWSGGIKAMWNPGEKGAHKAFYTFIEHRLKNYLRRDFPAEIVSSHLSPYLHFGEISPRQVWHAIHEHQASGGHLHVADKFLSELGWREFSHYLLYHFPALTEKPFNARFDSFKWSYNKAHLRAWQKGQTGYPIVDAGMRELWHTGYMHNRVRMVVASFLTKHLRTHWQEGAAWFLDTLVDADLANNSMGWQWVAGSGADAAPYFRIFNPILQGEKFDPKGEYVKRWVPELAGLSDKYIHSPWKAGKEELEKAAIALGKTYPKPIVEHETARAAAMAAYKKLRSF